MFLENKRWLILPVWVSGFETLFPETKKSIQKKCFGLEKQFIEKQKKVSRNFVSLMF